MKTTIANQNTVAAAVKEETMNKNTRYTVAVVVGSACNMKQVKQFQEWAARANANTDLIICGDPIRTRKLGKIIAGMKLTARVIGCNVENSEVFLYTHRDTHPCKWAIDHADTVITIGDGMVVSKAKKYSFETSRSCYNYGRQLVESICNGHYEKAPIKRGDIVTLNEDKAIKAEEAKSVAEPKVDLIAVAKAELDAAKKAYEAAKTKYDKLVAEEQTKPIAKEENKTIAQLIAEGTTVHVDTTGDVVHFRGQTYEVMVDDFEPLDTEDVEKAIKNGDIRPVGKSHNNMTQLVNTIADATTKPAEPVKADFTFEGHGYNVADKTAFNIEIFNEQDNETKKAIVEESLNSGHIVAA